NERSATGDCITPAQPPAEVRRCRRSPPRHLAARRRCRGYAEREADSAQPDRAGPKPAPEGFPAGGTGGTGGLGEEERYAAADLRLVRRGGRSLRHHLWRATLACRRARGDGDAARYRA